jgi:hypothetical protein
MFSFAQVDGNAKRPANLIRRALIRAFHPDQLLC